MQENTCKNQQYVQVCLQENIERSKQTPNPSYLVDVDMSVSYRKKVNLKAFYFAHTDQQAEKLKEQPILVLASAVIKLEKYSLIRNVRNRCKISSNNRAGQLRASNILVEEPVQRTTFDSVLQPNEMLFKKRETVKP